MSRRRQHQKRTRELLLTNQMLLRAIYGRLSMAMSTESDDETPIYECLVCQKEYYQHELEDHASHCFGYHPDMGEDVLMLKFEQV
uniref:Uncharacterized protein n=1 Tax=uncultured virus TaxID=340016 RepID=D5L2Q9_9VIRU|nr:hypothetical protein [uncultured virus]